MSDIELARFATLAASLLKGAQSLLRSHAERSNCGWE